METTICSNTLWKDCGGNMDDLEVYVKNNTYLMPECVGYIRENNINLLRAWLNNINQDNMEGKLQLTLGL